MKYANCAFVRMNWQNAPFPGVQYSPPVVWQFIITLTTLLQFVQTSPQCNLGLKLFSIESGNAICAPIADFQCIEMCEWGEAERGGCSSSSHYTAFRGRRTYLTGMVFTEGSFLVQCCASLATSVLLDTEYEPICHWTEQIETVVKKPSVRFDLPLGEFEYFRDLRGTRFGQGAAKIQGEICRYTVQRTNCDRRRMSSEDAHQYSLLLLRLQRTHDFLHNNASRLGFLNAGASDMPIVKVYREKARAHSTISKNNGTMVDRPVEIVSKEDEHELAEAVQKVATQQLLVPRENGIGTQNNNKMPKSMMTVTSTTVSPSAVTWPIKIYTPAMQTSIKTTKYIPTSSPQTVATAGPLPQSSTVQKDEIDGPTLYNTPRSYLNHLQQRSYGNSSINAKVFFRNGKSHNELMRYSFISSQHRQLHNTTNNNNNNNKSNTNMNRPRNHHSISIPPRHPLIPIRRLRPFPKKLQEHNNNEGEEGNVDWDQGKQQPQGPIRVKMSRLGWPKGLRRRVWPVLATNTTKELVPTVRRDFFTWIDSDDQDQHQQGGGANGGNGRGDFQSGPRVIQLDRIRRPSYRRLPSELNDTGPERETGSRILSKNIISNEWMPREENQFERHGNEEKRDEQRKVIFASGETAGAGGSFDSEEATVIASAPTRLTQPKTNGKRQGQGQEINQFGTSPLGKAPEFRVVPFVTKKFSSLRREGHVGMSSPFTLSSTNNNGIGGDGRAASELSKLLECCQEQAPGCRPLCTREVSKEQIKYAMSTGQCPPLSMTSVIQCFPRFYNISTVGQCCAATKGVVAANVPKNPMPSPGGMPSQCLSLCMPNFHLSFAHLACVEHTEQIMGCYRQLLEKAETDNIVKNGKLLLAAAARAAELRFQQQGPPEDPAPFAKKIKRKRK